MKSAKLILLLFIGMLSMNSCATIFTGTKDDLLINSKPEGAKVTVGGIDKGKTPVTVRMKKSLKGQPIMLKKEGYETRIFEPEKSFHIISVLNLTNPFAWGIDLLTGSIMKFDTNSYNIELDKKEKNP